MLVPYAEFTTAGLPVSDALELATYAVSEICAVQFKNDSCEMSLKGWRLDGLAINVCSSTATSIKRSKALIRRSGVDHYRARLCCRTGIVKQINGLEQIVMPGDISFTDLDKEIVTQGTDGEMVFLYIPRDTLDSLLPAAFTSRIHGHVIRSNTSMGQILSTQINTFHTVLPNLDSRDMAFAVSSTISLLAAGIAHTLNPSSPLPKNHPELIQASIKSFIVEHIRNPDLSPDLICKHFRISRATLYDMFKSFSGVACYIRAIRLQKCFNAIRDPLQLHLQIREIAFSHGFNNESHFSKIFRKEFGISPREARRALFEQHISASRFAATACNKCAAIDNLISWRCCPRHHDAVT